MKFWSAGAAGQDSRPSSDKTERKTRTMSGSNCFPEPAFSISTARARPAALRYGRSERTASYASATEIIRAWSGIASPRMPAHNVPVGLRQRARVPQDRVADPDLADIVQQRGCPETGPFSG